MLPGGPTVRTQSTLDCASFRGTDGLSGPLLFRPEQTKGAPGPEVIAVLKLEPQAELQALLDALKPVALAAGM